MLSFILALVVGSAVIEGARDSTVELMGTSVVNMQKINQSNSKKNWNECSGFMVAPGVVATARHCVTFIHQTLDGIPMIEKFYVTKVEFYDGSSAKVLRIKTDKDADLAYLYTDDTKHSALPLTDKAYIGEQLFVLGAPAGRKFSYSNAYLMQGSVPTNGLGDPKFNWNGSFLIDCPSCYSGDSGGPVINMDGEVVGVLVAGEDRPEASLIEPAGYVMQDLNETGK